MARYDYYCSACEERWEEVQFMNDRDAPLSEPCPVCGIKGEVTREIKLAPHISYAGAKTVLERAGSGWNDVLTGIKKAAGKKSTILTR